MPDDQSQSTLSQFGIDTTATPADETADKNNSDSPDHPFEFEDPGHELKANWQWSDAVLNFVAEHREGFTAVVGPGLSPIGDINIDIKDLRELAAHPDAEFGVRSLDPEEVPEAVKTRLADGYNREYVYGEVFPATYGDARYTGYAAFGDAFDLPLETNSVDALVTDPPWRGLSINQRAALTEEIQRVTRPTGIVVSNTPWRPEHRGLSVFDSRFRQQDQVYDNPSLLNICRASATSVEGLFDAYSYTKPSTTDDSSPFWGYPFPPQWLSLENNTDPNCVDPTVPEYVCAYCGCTTLTHVTDPHFEENGQLRLYQCRECQKRWWHEEITMLVDALETAARRQGVADITELGDMQYTHPDFEHRSDIEDLPIDWSLPWAPDNRAQAETSHSGQVSGAD